MESDDASLRTGAPATATASGTAATVASSDSPPSGLPHVRQKRLSGGTTAAHAGHCIGVAGFYGETESSGSTPVRNKNQEHANSEPNLNTNREAKTRKCEGYSSSAGAAASSVPLAFFIK